MRKLLIGLLGFATLGLGALTAAPQAEAQPYYGGYGYRRPVVEYRAGPVVVHPVQYRRHRPAYRPVPAYRPMRVARRCWVEPRRVWNGFRWVRRPIQVCRTFRGPGYRW